ncbi:MAG TPA: neutral zinc metallopeptidase [Longimicrobiales bacterium]|nr:neutral zinc metallopeptidase [Longimicrobiales bacterium]
MKWKRARRSTNIEDRRGIRPATGMKVGGGAALILVIVTLVMGGDPGAILQMLETGGGTAPTEAGSMGTPDDEAGEFIAAVLGDTEDTWSAIFAASGSTYQPPTLVLFTDAVQSACGTNSAAVGPFYCPPDQQVYIDLSFFRDLHERFGAPGDFAQAYVIAHEVGHHVQNLLGIAERVHSMRSRSTEAQSNALSVRMELQADCFAGIWGYHARTQRDLLDRGDVEEALAAAAAIGDDRLQRQSTGRVSPESFTHGTSEQRMRWFRSGLQSGSVDRCDTFSEG